MIVHKMLPIGLLDENPANVNEMDDATFNQLCEGIQESGVVPTILVAPKPDGRYFVIDGNHRKRAAVLLGKEEVSCDVMEGLSDSDLQEILSARIAVVRGSVNKTRFTSLWLKVRQTLDEREAMHVLGVTSERQLHQLVQMAKRRTDANVMADDAVQMMLKRARAVDGLATVIRAATGDGGLGEFDYLVFQVGGSNIMLVRCKTEELAELQNTPSHIADRKIGLAEAFVRAMRLLIVGNQESPVFQLIDNATATDASNVKDGSVTTPSWPPTAKASKASPYTSGTTLVGNYQTK